VLEIVQLICEAVGTGVEAEMCGSALPEGEIERQVIDYGKLHTTDRARGGIARTVQWYRQHPTALQGG